MNSAGTGSRTDPGRKLGPLGSALEWRIMRLQSEYLRDAPSAKATLAQLRRGLGKPAGSILELWEITVGAVPESLSWDRDEPSRAEQAAHAVLTLFALHQQSLSIEVHTPDTSFGRAVGSLRSEPTWSEEAVARRFMAASTAESFDEVLVHLRGLITQLRSARRSFDYARLADDLTGLLTPGRATRIRLAWGRDFYRMTTDTTKNDTEDSSDNNTEGEKS